MGIMDLLDMGILGLLNMGILGLFDTEITGLLDIRVTDFPANSTHVFTSLTPVKTGGKLVLC